MLTSTSCEVEFFTNNFLLTASPILIFSKNNFGKGVNGASDKTSISSESFFGLVGTSLIFALTGEIYIIAYFILMYS